MVPTDFPVPEAPIVGQGPPGLLPAALAGDEARSAVLGGPPKPSCSCRPRTHPALHQHWGTAGPQAHGAAWGEARTRPRILEAVAEDTGVP